MRLFGKNSVIERLRGNPSSIKKIFFEQGVSGLGAIQKKAKQHNIPIFNIPSSKMLKIARARNAQGVLVEVEDFPYLPYEDLLETAIKKKRCLIFLDGLNDPQNFGAIIRSIACLGKFSIVLPRHDSVSVTEAVLRVASGGDNYVPMAQVANLNHAIKSAKAAGYWIAGAVVNGGQPLNEIRMPLLTGLIIGSEQKGIREVIRKNLDAELTIPMFIHTLSLNVGHAVAIICYEITKQKNSKRQSNENV